MNKSQLIEAIAAGSGLSKKDSEAALKATLDSIEGALNNGLTLVQAECLIAALVGGTLFVTMIISRLVGCSLPFLAKLIKLDPAVMCGPITTTMVDIISLVTYFLIWTQVLNPLFFHIA